MINEAEISVIILAGGKSSRMGQDKRVIHLNGKSLISYSIDLANEFSDDIIISANDQLQMFTPYKIVPDIESEAGPVIANISSLKQIKHKAAIVITCDMPFISNDLIRILIQESNKNAITYFSNKGSFYPFPSIFPISFLKDIIELSRKGKNSLKDLMLSLPTNKIQIPANPNKYSFLNVNRPTEYEKALEIFPNKPDLQQKQ